MLKNKSLLVSHAQKTLLEIGTNLVCLDFFVGGHDVWCLLFFRVQTKTFGGGFKCELFMFTSPRERENDMIQFDLHIFFNNKC